MPEIINSGPEPMTPIPNKLVTDAAKLIRPLADLDPTNEPETTKQIGREASEAIAALLQHKEEAEEQCLFALSTLDRVTEALQQIVSMEPRTDVQRHWFAKGAEALEQVRSINKGDRL